MDEPYVIPAGRCEIQSDVSPPKVKPCPEAGDLVFYSSDDGFLHLKWCKRGTRLEDASPEFGLIPFDAVFQPYQPESPPGGRIYVLKFRGGSEKHLFWLQSMPADPSNPSAFSPEDLDHKIWVKRMMVAVMQGVPVDREFFQRSTS